jgi:glycosyltransferase involved in cell wall biosynthesis
MNKTHRKIKILFVCYANSAHALNWVSLLPEEDFDIRIFSTNLMAETTNTRIWPHATYITVKPDPSSFQTNRIISLLPGKGVRTLSNLINNKFSVNQKFLSFVIQNWKPDIIHSMPLDIGGKLTSQVLKKIPHNKWPKWVASAWGSDLSFGSSFEKLKQNIYLILNNCDGFFADSKSDLDMAVSLGLAENKLAFPYPIPGQGGIDPSQIEQSIRIPLNDRKIILIPKAFERSHANRTLPILEALSILRDKLGTYTVHLVSTEKHVEWYLGQLPEQVRNHCICHSAVPQKDLFALMEKARIVIAPSLSDGTPNVLLEAMAAGALPIMSPIPAHMEWIKDGENGLLAHALHPEQLANAIERGLVDDELFRNAQIINKKIIFEKANRNINKEKILTYYRRLIKW